MNRDYFLLILETTKNNKEHEYIPGVMERDRRDATEQLDTTVKKKGKKILGMT